MLHSVEETGSGGQRKRGAVAELRLATPATRPQNPFGGPYGKARDCSDGMSLDHAIQLEVPVRSMLSNAGGEAV